MAGDVRWEATPQSFDHMFVNSKILHEIHFSPESIFLHAQSSQSGVDYIFGKLQLGAVYQYNVCNVQWYIG